MEEAMTARHWCHMCSQMVHPIMGVEMKCPFCQSGFIEEMDGPPRDNPEDRPLSLWAPILMGMMRNPRRRHRLRRQDPDEDEEDDDQDDENDDSHGGETELDRELESIIRRRRRNSSTILQLLRGIRAAGLASESDNSETDRDRDRDREREPLILINPFNQTIILHGSYDSSQGQNNNHTPIGSLGDYFIGPGLDLLLQHLAENDPNRYGTPPAKKEAVEGLPTVTIKENLQCSVCLDDLQIGVEAKEMPCKHRFHGGCILPWLELHSSCPVCRFQLPADEARCHSSNSRNSSNQSDAENIVGDGEENADGGVGIARNGSGRRFQVPWPFSLFASVESQTSSGGNSSSSANATGSANGSGSTQADDN